MSVRHGATLNCCPTYKMKLSTWRACQSFIRLSNGSVMRKTALVQKGATSRRAELSIYRVTVTKRLALSTWGSAFSSCLPPQPSLNKRCLIPSKTCRSDEQNMVWRTFRPESNEINAVVVGVYNVRPSCRCYLTRLSCNTKTHMSTSRRLQDSRSSTRGPVN